METGSFAFDGSGAEQDMRECICAQVEEIMKFKWYMGERLKHDPLHDHSMNDICKEWIDKHAAEFRERWQNRTKQLAAIQS